MKKLLSALVVLGLVGSAWAGSKADDAKQMNAMKAEMLKCSVCKHIGAKLDAIGPMTTEVVHLDNGVAIVHTVQKSANVPILHAACVEVGKAGEACMKMTDAQAKTDLCSFCQDIRSAAIKGANVSSGPTKAGSILVLASNDPVVQKDIAALAAKCEMMHEQQQSSR